MDIAALSTYMSMSELQNNIGNRNHLLSFLFPILLFTYYLFNCYCFNFN